MYEARDKERMLANAKQHELNAAESLRHARRLRVEVARIWGDPIIPTKRLADAP